MHSALTSYAGNSNSVAARLKAKLAVDTQHNASAFSPIDFSPREDDERPKRKLTEGNKAVVRVIAQYLQDLGLTDTARTLSRETRCGVENGRAVRLREAIHEGNWDDAVAIIDACYDHLTEKVRETARNILFEEKFFDLMIKQKRPLALHMLKVDIDPTNPMRDRLLKLLFEKDEQIFRKKAYEKYRPSLDARNGNDYPDTDRICARLQKALPASFMLPTARLQTLLGQALETQVSRCETHSHTAVPAMLLHDHKCPKRGEQYFVEKCVREDHKSEVWKVAFSPCGKYLASASFATVVHFWKVNPRTRQLDFYRKIVARDTTHAIFGMSWSADSRLLAVCGVDEHPYSSYIYNMHGDCLFTRVPHLDAASFNCIDFFERQLPDGRYQLTVGDTASGMLQFMEIAQNHARVISIYEGYRIRGVYSCRSGRGAYGADTHNRVRWYRNDAERKSDHTVIREEDTITNMCMHPSEQLLLLTTKNLGLRMWNVQARTLMRTFQGYHDGGCVISAAFGGINNEYIVAGSFSADEHDENGDVVRRSEDEDCSSEETIRIWRLTDEYLVCGIAGHRSTVNCVSWNPKDPFMIASGSDDHSIRLWSCRAEDVHIPEHVDDDDELIDETPLNKGDDDDLDVTGSSDSEDSSDEDEDMSDGSEDSSEYEDEEDNSEENDGESVSSQEFRLANPQEGVVHPEEYGEEEEEEYYEGEEGEEAEEEHGVDDEEVHTESS